MERTRLAILHYSALPLTGDVESTIADQARRFADRGCTVKVIVGRGEPFDPRVALQIIPLVDSKHSFVLQVTRKLESGIVNRDFYSLTAAIRHILKDALTDTDVCIAHNILTLHKNLALTVALHELTRTNRLRLIGWCHDLAWQDPVYARELYAGSPWDLLRQVWPGARYVVVSETRREQLSRLLGLDEADIAVVPPDSDASEFLGIDQMATGWTSNSKAVKATRA